MLHGTLVDLVPSGRAYFDRKAGWENGPAGFWGSAGDRPIFTQGMMARWREHRLASLDKGLPVRLEFGVQAKDGTPIGQAGINFMSATHRCANLGITLGEPEYWGGGYGTDALMLFVDYCFNWLDLRRVEAGTMGSNVRVHRMMDKIGFTLEGRQREHWYADGAWQDNVMYAMLQDEWPGYAALVAKLGLTPR